MGERPRRPKETSGPRGALAGGPLSRGRRRSYDGEGSREADRPSTPHALLGFADELVHHVAEVARLRVRRELAVGAGALREDAVGVLHLGAAAELVHDVADEPLDQLDDELARGQLGLPPEVDELAVEAVADGPPLVLLDE